MVSWSGGCGGGGGGDDDGGDPPPVCGNGLLEAGEGCDDGNAEEADACLSTCVSATCGDGVVQAGVEACDRGAANSDTAPDACRSTCTRARCGDGVKDAGEGCDDGNASDTDACLSTCVSATCGDGLVEAGVEACDDGDANSDSAPDACRTNCTAARCGDAVTDTGEACDDGNASNTDVCLTTCATASCGDGYVQQGVEECDAGAANSDTAADACRTTCRDPACGDAVADTGEACDDGNASDTDACRTTCVAATCAGPLRGRYSFEETVGLVLDTSGCELHGGASDAVVRGVSGLGLAAGFGAAGAHVAVPGVVASSFDGNFTLEAWVYRPANAGGPVLALASGSGVEGFVISVDATGHLHVATGSIPCTSTLNRGTPSVTIPGDGWSHVAIGVLRENSLMYMYYFIDGRFTMTSLTGNIPTCHDASDRFTVGAVGPGTGPRWPGRIDEVKLWTSVRATSEVCADAGGIYSSSTATCDLGAVRPPP